MFKIVIFLITITLFSLSATPLLKTGQTVSYNVNDDGYYQTGATRNYGRSGDIVIDNVTGLEWQDISATDTWQNAVDYCGNSTLDGGNWRLASIKELETLVDSREYNASFSEGIFQNIDAFSYFSSTIDVKAEAEGDSKAWILNALHGDSSTTGKSLPNDILCVKGEPLDDANLSRNGEVVSDSTTALQWQDDGNVTSTKKTWTAAIEYCENLSFGEQSDWRLPNKNELLSIVNHLRSDPAIDNSVFVNTAPFGYWSSTTNAQYSNEARIVSFSLGVTGVGQKDELNYVRCIRNGQLENPTPSDSNFSLVPIIMYLLN